MFVPEIVSSLKDYSRKTFLADLFAGLTVGVIALPLAMAFAIASGVPPERGLFTAVVAGLLISLFGGSRVQIGGPTGAFVVIVAGIVMKYGYDGLVWCSILAGGFLIAIGLARMGGLIKFIPFPVTTGFTSGIAVVIFSTQIKDLLGLRIDSVPAEFFEKWVTYIEHLDTINFSAMGIGVGTIAVILVVRKLWPRVPAMLVGMLAATIAVSVFHLDVETIGSRFGDLPRTLPMPRLPSITPEQLRELVAPAFTVGLLAAIESLLSATVADGMTGGRHKPNMELVGQGIANIGSVLFGGIPATGAIARTATNVKSGAKTPVAGIIHAITLFLLLLFLAPLAKAIPLAALAGILVVVSYNMSEVDHFIGLLKAPRSDVMVLLSTFALTVLVDLTVAVEVGIVMASLLFIRRMAEVSSVGMITRELGPDEDERPDPNSLARRRVPEGVEVFEVQGAFFFGAADRFKETMRTLEKPPKVLILRLRNVLAIDATGLHVLEELLHMCKRDNTTLILSGVHAQPLVAMQRKGLWDAIGSENIHGHIDVALDRAHDVLGLPHPAHPVPFVPNVAREGAPPQQF
ncbi:MAG: sulfate permease, SulP family [Candidatus Sumerlaeota bacterium]|nr:sulfate permease, SulP family [Candidatus Sumerlaeota bacterium]